MSAGSSTTVTPATGEEDGEDGPTPGSGEPSDRHERFEGPTAALDVMILARATTCRW